MVWALLKPNCDDVEIITTYMCLSMKTGLYITFSLSQYLVESNRECLRGCLVASRSRHSTIYEISIRTLCVDHSVLYPMKIFKGGFGIVVVLAWRQSVALVFSWPTPICWSMKYSIMRLYHITFTLFAPKMIGFVLLTLAWRDWTGSTDWIANPHDHSK